MTPKVPSILSIEPRAGLPGGEVEVACENLHPSSHDDFQAYFGLETAHVISVSPQRAILSVPEIVEPVNEIPVRVEVGGARSNSVGFFAGRRIASDLHPVANPAIDPDNGSIYTTLSGTRGQKVPVSIYKISPAGDVQPFLSDITNPTGLAFDPQGQLFVSSRSDGIVYRVNPLCEAEPFSRNLGVATGIAFDGNGVLYVGDRTGTVYRINGIGEAEPFASLEPSVAAYHLAFGPDGYLYVTGPTISSYESIVKISPDGVIEKFYTGLGRPQGLAFDREGNLYCAASWKGQRGIVKFTPTLEITRVIAGSSIVGLAFDSIGNAIVVTTREVYNLPLGIFGTMLRG